MQDDERSVRIDGRIVREYYGRGPLAEIMAPRLTMDKDHLKSLPSRNF
jgi:hypothetical protein